MMLLEKMYIMLKIKNTEKQIPDITNLATATAVFTAVENEIPIISNVVNKTDYNTKINEIKIKITNHNQNKYITISELNKLTVQNFDARLAQATLVTNTDFDNKLMNLNKKINSNKTKYLLVVNELKKLKTFDSIYFSGKSHFENDVTQNYLVFQPTQRYFTSVRNTNNHIL